MHPTAQLRTTLKTTGHSVTSVRLALFAALTQAESLTMHQLVARCPDIDRASVYRNVELFQQLGIVQRVQLGWKYRLELSDAFHEHHHHATCLTCGQSFVLAEDAAIESSLQMLARQIGFRLERHQLELQGYCSACTPTTNS